LDIDYNAPDGASRKVFDASMHSNHNWSSEISPRAAVIGTYRSRLLEQLCALRRGGAAVANGAIR
jgi:hypothetical protein